jgi:Tol biopolymer transport system component
LGDPGISDAESLALFGLPISPLQEEDIEGQTYQVQWFERARFELHPENAPPFDVLLGLLGREAQGTGTAAPLTPTGRLAFVRQGDIYTIHADGTDERQLTTHPADDYPPVWSPDGTRIAFTSFRDGQQEVYVMQADGSQQTRLTTSTRWAEIPTWSPDGTRLAYAQNGEIVLYDLTTATSTAITARQAGERAYNEPVWSPDGTQVAFWQAPIGAGAVFLADLTSGQITRLTDGIRPRWSPDGTTILFEQSVPTENLTIGRTDLFRINVDGSGLVNLTQNPDIDDWWAAWSPDGRQIAFSQGISQESVHIAVMQANGSLPRQLPRAEPELPYTSLADMQPTWSLDGRYIAFVRIRHTNASSLAGIHLMRADGTGEERVLAGGGNSHPAWQP